MSKRSALILFFVMLSLMAFSQRRFTISGYVKDSLSAETLISATVTAGSGKASVRTNQYGFFSITLPGPSVDLTISFTGYQPIQVSLTLAADTGLNFSLLPRDLLTEVVVSAGRRDQNIREAQMGRIDLSMNQIKEIPVVMGEADVLKTLQLLPGVGNAGEGNTGLYIRGGGPDQNLIMLDDAVVYNTGHLFGFFSIFNGDAIKSVSLIKGGMPAQYGGRLSSVLDVSMKEGNMKKIEGEGGIGLIASRFSLQGPIVKDKASFMVSGRRTYIDLLTRPFLGKGSQFEGSGYYFYDLNTKINYRFSDRDRLYLSGYFGRDVFSFNNKERSFRADIPWGNSTATVRWNHVFNPRLFANTTLVYNKYNFSFGGEQQDISLKLSSGIRDWNAKLDFDYYPAPKHKLKFGALQTFHKFIPNILSGNQGDTEFEPNNDMQKFALESALYIQDEWEMSEKFSINAGLRYSSFSQVGPYTIFKRDAAGNKVDSTIYPSGSRIKTYGGVEPRLTIRYALSENGALKSSASRNLQYIHLVSNSGSTLPTDLWVPSTYMVKPQISWQYAAGYFHNFNNNLLETSVEFYYKDMQNQIEYREGYTPSLTDPEEEFVFGKGWSYGAEIFINKTRGKFSGWMGYTLSWTWRKFASLNNGNKYPAKYDRRHDLSLVGLYKLTTKWSLSAVFVYGTGNASTLPERFYFINGNLMQEYGQLNQFRLPPYHRLDLSATYTPQQKPNRKLKTSWVFSIYNAYSRLNPYFIYYDQQGSPANGTLEVQAKQVSLFPIIPSVTWNFKF